MGGKGRERRSTVTMRESRGGRWDKEGVVEVGR